MSKEVIKIHSEKGASMLEYALMAALIAVVAITALTSLGGSVGDKFNQVSDNLAGAGTT